LGITNNLLGFTPRLVVGSRNKKGTWAAICSGIKIPHLRGVKEIMDNFLALSDTKKETLNRAGCKATHLHASATNILVTKLFSPFQGVKPMYIE
jgi:hypothetical protein